MASKPNGVILWEGNGLVAVATGIGKASANVKTGAMIQVWVICNTVDPVTAIRTGADEACCGTCPLRGNGCYVTARQAPASVYRAYNRGTYPHWDGKPFARPVRLGAYGDVSQVPASLVGRLSACPAAACGRL